MKKIIIALFVVLFIGLIIFISTFYMSNDAETHGSHIPNNIGAFQLTNKIEGDEAKEIMNEIHGQKVDLDQAYALEYQTVGGSYALVWISETNDEEIPIRLLESMQRIVNNSQSYSEQQEKEFNNIIVNYAFRKGLDHYYFVIDNRFIWVSTFEDKKSYFIKNAVKNF